MKKPFKRLMMCVTMSFCVTSCWERHPNTPLAINIGGQWRWTKTMDGQHNVLESASATKTAGIVFSDLPYPTDVSEKVEFFVNEKSVDSLFMPINDSYNSAIEQGRQLYVTYQDSQKNPVTVRFRFFFPKKRYSATKMEINIQRNTSVYNPDADTLISEYVAEIR